jgi:hypothetical protein
VVIPGVYDVVEIKIYRGNQIYQATAQAEARAPFWYILRALKQAAVEIGRKLEFAERNP